VFTRRIVADDINPKLAENPKGLQEFGDFACAISCFLDTDLGSRTDFRWFWASCQCPFSDAFEFEPTTLLSGVQHSAFPDSS
jgi:hypothetical protein